MAKRQPAAPADDEIEVVGARRIGARDLYHFLLRAPWTVDVALLSATFVLANLVFAAGFHLTGGVANAHGFVDEFFYSVETMGTIGYGEMYPTTRAAHAIVTVEAVAQIFLIAMTTGLVFAKFSIPRARVRFAAHPVVTLYDGVPTLMFRIGNERASRLIEAVVRVVAIRTERTREGITMYRMRDLVLERERSPALARSWTVLHAIDERSPLYPATPESLAQNEVELIMTLTGTDELSAQMLYAQRRWTAEVVRFGARHADLLSELPDGRLRLDMRRFDELVATEASDAFPWSHKAV